MRARVMPCLLVRRGALVKTIQFKDPGYVGDPVNAVHIFNEKEVDELIVLDISATPDGTEPPYELIAKIATEAFMPVAYGGGVRNLAEVKRILNLGIEKVVLNTEAFEVPTLVAEAAAEYGSQAVVVSIDARAMRGGAYEVFVRGGRTATGRDPREHAVRMAAQGAGEVVITSIDRDGTMKGYDTELVRRVADAVTIPVIANGGAGAVADFRSAVDAGAAACAAGAMFVYYGRNRAVLINFPERSALDAALT